MASRLKRFWTRSIRRQLILGIALVHAVLMTIFVFDLVHRQQIFMHQQAITQAARLGETLAANGVSWVLAGDVVGLEEIVQSQARYPGLSYAMVLNSRGRVLAHTDPTKVGLFVSDPVSRRLLGALPRPHILVADQDMIDVAEPIMANNRLIGWARVGLTQHKLTAGLKIVARDGVVYVIIAILAGTLFAALMARGLTASLSRVVRVAGRIRQGDYGLRVPVDREDELGVLAEDFNGMLDALAQREQQRTALLENIPDMAWLKDKGGRYVAVNEAFEKASGLPRSEIFGKTDYDIWPPDTAAKYSRDDREVMKRAGRKKIEEQVPHASGFQRWMETIKAPVLDQAGEVSGSAGIARDITERREAERALRESEARFHAIFRDAGIGVALVGEGGQLVQCNPALQRMLGCGEEALLGMTFSQFTHPEDVEKGVQPFLELMAGKRDVFAIEKRYIRKSGEVIHANLTVTAIRGEQEMPTFAVGVVKDVTARKQAEAALGHVNQLYAVLSRVNETIVRVRERQSLFQEVCRIAVESGGLRFAWVGLLEEATGAVRPVAYRGHEDGYLDGLDINLNDRETRRGPIARVIAEGIHTVVDDIAGDPRMGPWRERALQRGYRSSAGFPLKEGGRIIGVFSLYAAVPEFFAPDIVRLISDLATDVSFALDAMIQEERRREAEAELKNLNEELEARVGERTRNLEVANQELEAFSYSVSHDLRGPLRSVDGFSRIALEEYGEVLGSDGRDYLGRVRRASQRMGELIDDLLWLARVTRSGMNWTPVDLSKMVHAVAAELHESFPERRVELVVREGVVVQGDMQLLQVAMENLIGNAWKFTRDQPEPRIEFDMFEKGAEHVMFVRDNGAGFDMEYVHKLFGPFQRLHSQDEFEGTGIGLATTYRVIQRHGGRLWAEGEVNEGATFYFTL